MTQLTTELCTTQQHDDAIHEAIAKHAFALYESEGFKDGNDQDHWFRAERELTYPDASVVFENEASFQTIRVPLEGGFSLLVSISPRNVLMFAAGNGGGAVEREVLRIILSAATTGTPDSKSETNHDNGHLHYSRTSLLVVDRFTLDSTTPSLWRVGSKPSSESAFLF